MLTRNKTFSTFNSPQKPLSFVGINCVLNVFTVRNQLKIIKSIIRAVQIFMVNFHSFGNGSVKRFPHCTMDSYFSIFSIFARTKPHIMIARYVRFNGARSAISRPCFTMLNTKRGRNTSTKKFSYFAQRSSLFKHIFSVVNLLSAKQLSARYTSNVRQITYFIKALIAPHRFPNFHTVDINPVYVGSQA